MLDIDMEFRKGILFVRLRGVLNGDTALELDENLTSIITDNGIKYLLINLNELTNIDKYGLKVIFKNYQNININNGKFILCGGDKLSNYTGNIIDNLYQVSDEMKAFEVISI